MALIKERRACGLATQPFQIWGLVSNVKMFSRTPSALLNGNCISLSVNG